MWRLTQLIFLCLLLPSIAANGLICVCAASNSGVHTHESTASCCAEKHSTQDKTPHDCRHCDGTRSSIAVGDATASNSLKAAAQIEATVFAIWQRLESASPVSTRIRRTDWTACFSPPSDLLRLHCALLI